MGKMKESIEFDMYKSEGFFGYDGLDVCKIRKKLDLLKLHIDQMDTMTRQAMDLIYEIEDRIVCMEGII